MAFLPFLLGDLAQVQPNADHDWPLPCPMCTPCGSVRSLLAYVVVMAVSSYRVAPTPTRRRGPDAMQWPGDT